MVAECTSIEEQQDSGLGGGGGDVNGLRPEVAAQHCNAVVVVPLQLPMLYRRVIIVLRTNIKINMIK